MFLFRALNTEFLHIWCAYVYVCTVWGDRTSVYEYRMDRDRVRELPESRRDQQRSSGNLSCCATSNVATTTLRTCEPARKGYLLVCSLLAYAEAFHKSGSNWKPLLRHASIAARVSGSRLSSNSCGEIFPSPSVSNDLNIRSSMMAFLPERRLRPIARKAAKQAEAGRTSRVASVVESESSERNDVRIWSVETRLRARGDGWADAADSAADASHKDRGTEPGWAKVSFAHLA